MGLVEVTRVPANEFLVTFRGDPQAVTEMIKEGNGGDVPESFGLSLIVETPEDEYKEYGVDWYSYYPAGERKEVHESAPDLAFKTLFNALFEREGPKTLRITLALRVPFGVTAKDPTVYTPEGFRTLRGLLKHGDREEVPADALSPLLQGCFVAPLLSASRIDRPSKSYILTPPLPPLTQGSRTSTSLKSARIGPDKTCPPCQTYDPDYIFEACKGSAAG